VSAPAHARPPQASAFYEGTIRHRRIGPESEFSHRIALAYVDLDELPRLLGGRLTRRGPGTLRFDRRDYLGDASTPLDVAVRDRVQSLCGERPAGPIRLLAQLRSFGVCFNPVSFYYCMDEAGERVEHVLAEVTNTPWGERHAYLLSDAGSDAKVISGDFEKALHVSPFFGMDHVYHARASAPGPTLSVHIENEHAGAVVFDATLNLRRRAMTRATAARMAVRHPAASARVLALIYGHALGAKLAGARYFPHPARAS
jgi:DUF1365 family protein